MEKMQSLSLFFFFLTNQNIKRSWYLGHFTKYELEVLYYFVVFNSSPENQIKGTYVPPYNIQFSVKTNWDINYKLREKSSSE